MKPDFALVIPMANESEHFYEFVSSLTSVLDNLTYGNVYFVVDNVSKDSTLELCNNISDGDKRFHTIWAPENKNVVDAYIRGYREALQRSDADYIIEMDAGLSHDPASLGTFIHFLDEGYDCVYGSRFIEGGSMGDS